jgi:hypothetical protein
MESEKHYTSDSKKVTAELEYLKFQKILEVFEEAKNRVLPGDVVIYDELLLQIKELEEQEHELRRKYNLYDETFSSTDKHKSVEVNVAIGTIESFRAKFNSLTHELGQILAVEEDVVDKKSGLPVDIAAQLYDIANNPPINN